VRALEVTLGSGRPFSEFGPGLEEYPPSRFLLVGLFVERADLGPRIERRVRQMMDDGFLDEVRALRSRPAGWSRTAAQALGYRELASHLDGESTLEEAVAETVVRTRQFAVRQDRWFRRDPRIEWLPAPRTPSETRSLADTILGRLESS
jgi:tRNA dimethylallyltransferase